MKMNGKKHYLILYDIRNEKRLTKVAKILESYSIRVQYSVFESDMPELIMKQMKSRLEKVIDTTEDFVLIFDPLELQIELLLFVVWQKLYFLLIYYFFQLKTVLFQCFCFHFFQTIHNAKAD